MLFTKKIPFILLVCLVLIPFSVCAKSRHLTILHFNDLHGHLSTENTGGAARIATIIDNVRNENKITGGKTILFFGGDALTGALISMEFAGSAEFDFFNLLGLDAMVLGNHDFDLGAKRIEELIGIAKFPVVAANIYNKESGERFVEPFVLVGAPDKIAVLGLANKNTPNLTNPKNVSDLLFEDPIVEAKKDMDELKRLSPFRIALTHTGAQADVRLAKSAVGFFAIIGGHDHVSPNRHCKIVRKIPVCQTPPNGTYVGRVDFEIDGKKARYVSSTLIPVDSNVAENEATAEILSKYEKIIGKKYDRIVGRASEDLIPSRDRLSALGTLVAKAIQIKTHADAAFLNSGGIRAPIKRGPISLKDIFEALPFDNRLVVLNMSGETIVKTLLHKGAPLQLSNISYEKTDGELVNIKINNRPIENDRIYKIGTIDFLANGGDGFTMLKNITERQNLNILLRDAVAEHIKKKKIVP